LSNNEAVIESEVTNPDAPPVGADDPGDVPLEGRARFPGYENVDPNDDKSIEGEELLAGKFKSQDDLVKAYKELESKLGWKEKPKPVEDTRKAASEALKEKGLDLSAYETEYFDQGELSAESYTKLGEAGFSKELVNNYLAGQKALSEKFAEQVYEMAGGSEAYSELMGWAKDSLPDNVKVAFNEVVTSGNLETVDLMIAGLKAKRDAAGGGSEPQALVHGDKAVASTAGYNSVDEMVKDMNDPKYLEGNPAWHLMVDRRLANAKF